MNEFMTNLAALMTVFLGCFGFIWYIFYVTEKRLEARFDHFATRLDAFSTRLDGFDLKLNEIEGSVKELVKDMQIQRERTDKLYSILIDLVSAKKGK